MLRGSWSFTETGLTSAETSNGPMKFGLSFLDSVLRGTKRVDSHTFCPTVYAGAGVWRRSAICLFWPLVLSNAVCAAPQARRHLRRWAWTDGTECSPSTEGKRGGWKPSETSKGDLEGRPTGGGGSQTVMGVLNPGQFITPDGLVRGRYAPQYCLELLVSSLTLTVALGMVTRG